MALEMLGRKIAVIPIEDPSKVGSLYVPDQAKQRVDQGIVKYRGPRCKVIRVGMHVVFSGYTGTKISVEDEGTLYIMHELDVECLMNDDEAMSVFPLVKILQIIDLVDGEMHRRFNAETCPIMSFSETAKSMFRDHFYSEGLSF